MAGLQEMALELGQQLGRTEEYQALRRAIQAADDDREVVELRNELRDLEVKLESSLRRGEQPEEEDVEAYEAAAGRLQASSTYQRLVAAQTNFDKVVRRVNDTIARGIDQGGQSRIIIPG